MHPPFGPIGPNGRCHRRGSSPFVLQFLRAPLTLNNLVALCITYSVFSDRLANTKLHVGDKQNLGCRLHRPEALFGVLTLFFAVSLIHNMLTVARFHRIRKQVFGESLRTAHRRWRQRAENGDVAVSEEEREAWHLKFKEMGKRMPSLIIPLVDTVLAVHFLGLYIVTTMYAKREGKVELGVAYASIGALVAFILNLIVGFTGLDLWGRSRKEKGQPPNEEAPEKEALLGKF